MNALRAQKKLDILRLLVEGNSVRSTERLARVHRDTVLRLLLDAGRRCRTFLGLYVRDLARDHWEIDEIWTFCRKKEKRLTPEEKAEGVWGDQYLFLAVGQKTKLIPAFLVGRRDEHNARLFVQDLASRLKISSAQRHRLSSDGFIPYPEAVRLVFGEDVDYGVLMKEYTATTVRIARQVILGTFDEEGICTSHVERNNLTIRTFMRRYVRKTLGFSKKVENLTAAVALHVAYYNFCRKHLMLKMTPAMAAGLAKRPWTLEVLLETVGMLKMSA